jgi:hypothetical protein
LPERTLLPASSSVFIEIERYCQLDLKSSFSRQLASTQHGFVRQLDSAWLTSPARLIGSSAQQLGPLAPLRFFVSLSSVLLSEY